MGITTVYTHVDTAMNGCIILHVHMDNTCTIMCVHVCPGLHSATVERRIARAFKVKVSSGAVLAVSEEPFADTGHHTQSSED